MPRRRSSASPTTASSRICSPPSPSSSRLFDAVEPATASPSSADRSTGFFSPRSAIARAAAGANAMSYVAPVKDMLFCMKELADLEAIARLPGFEEAGLDTAQAVLEECARFTQEVLAPLNREGDVRPSSWQGGVV